jgi:hypothetical protein
MSTSKMLSRAELQTFYGAFYDRPKRKLNPARIPSDLHPLIPYAEFWGIDDDFDREALVDAAPPGVVANLCAVVVQNNDAFDDWLAGAEANDPEPSPEYCAFTTMRMAADYGG